MKTEEAFKDLKRLLGLEKLRNKTVEKPEMVVALLLLASVAGLLVGEFWREKVLAPRRRPLYSGRFVLLKGQASFQGFRGTWAPP